MAHSTGGALAGDSRGRLNQPLWLCREGIEGDERFPVGKDQLLEHQAQHGLPGVFPAKGGRRDPQHTLHVA